MAKDTTIRRGATAHVQTQNGDRGLVPDNSVSTAKIQPLAVTNEKVADATLSFSKLNSILQSLLTQENIVDNPEGLMFQRTTPGTPTNVANDVYGPDRWNILCSANNVAVSRSTSPGTGARFAVKLDKATATGFFGMCQIKEAGDSIHLIGQQVTFTVSLKTESSEIANARISILGWTGTADAVTSSIVSSWASTPTYVASVTEYGAATLALTNSYQEVSVTATIGAGCNNLIFFVHTTASQAIGDSLFVSSARAYKSDVAMPYIRRVDMLEQQRCQRFFSKSYNIDTPPGSTVNLPGYNMITWISTTTSKFITTWFKVRMRTAPSVTLYSVPNGTSGVVTLNGGTDVTAATDYVSENTFVGGTTNATAATTLNYHWAADAEL